MQPSNWIPFPQFCEVKIPENMWNLMNNGITLNPKPYSNNTHLLVDGWWQGTPQKKRVETTPTWWHVPYQLQASEELRILCPSSVRKAWSKAPKWDVKVEVDPM